MSAGHTAFVGIGANLGQPEQAILAAITELGQLRETRVEAASAVYRSAPIGVTDRQPDYLNAVVQVDTGLGPQALLAELHAIERRHGRLRGRRNAARTLDLDLLLYDSLELAGDGLTLPHPRLHERAFVLVPLAQIAPALVIPGRGAVRTLLEGVAGQRVEPLETCSGGVR